MTLLTPKAPVPPELVHGDHCNICFHLATELVQLDWCQWDARCEDHGGMPRDPDEIIRVNKRSSH